MKKTSKYILFIALCCLWGGCGFLKKEEPKEALARVNNEYLYVEDISHLISKGTSKADSALMVSNYIENWIDEQLMLDRAELNLPPETQQNFESLVEDYRKKLYIKAYKDALVSKHLDTAFSEAEVSVFYEQNKEMFNLNENLVKLRYIHLSDSLSNFDQVKRRFVRFGEDDVKKLLDQELQFNSYSFNDSVWVSEIEVYEQIKPINTGNSNALLKKSNFLQLEDSLGVYLIFVKDVLFRKEQAPLAYVKPTIEQILLHKRKLELAKKLEKEIKDDAFKNEQIEIYR